MRIMGVDPGKTVGYCVLETPLDVTIRDQISYAHLEELRELVGDVDLIAIEDFRIAPDKIAMGDSVFASEVIGKIESWAEDAEVKVVRQPPTKKRFVNDLMIMYLEVPLIAHRGHELDAVRHALYYSLVDLNNYAHEDVFPKMKAYLEEEGDDE